MVNAPDLVTELVGFLHDKNPQVRAVAVQELVPYSTRGHANIAIFKSDGLRPITDLRLLMLDEPKTAHDALTILINLSQDPLIRGKLVDELCLNMILAIIISTDHGLADLASMLLSNLAKSDAIASLLTMTRRSAVTACVSPLVMNQLLDVYVRGHNKSLNPHANYDFLTNVFSDLTRFAAGRRFFVTRQAYDHVMPLEKIIVFLACETSRVRRTGVASVVKNCCFDVAMHGALLDEAPGGLNLLLCIQSALCGADMERGFRDTEREAMFDVLQFMEADQQGETDTFIITVLLDALLLLCSTRDGREHLRVRQTYAIVRELHACHADHDDIGECCDKLVNMLMRDEDPDMPDLDPTSLGAAAEAEEESDEELQITEV